MMTVEIRINGSMIAHIYARNAGCNNGDMDKYIYEYYRPETNKVVNGIVNYKRDNGACGLTLAIMKDAERKLLQ